MNESTFVLPKVVSHPHTNVETITYKVSVPRKTYPIVYDTTMYFFILITMLTYYKYNQDSISRGTIGTRSPAMCL